MGTTGTCESCGRDATDLVAVHRAYITPAAWDEPEVVDVQPGTEQWCFPCRTHYPHEPAGPA